MSSMMHSLGEVALTLSTSRHDASYYIDFDSTNSAYDEIDDGVPMGRD